MSHVTSHNIGVMCSLVNAGNVRKGSFKSHYYPLVRCHVSLGICQVSLVMCHASHFRSPGAMCKVSTFRCHVSCVSCEMSEEATAKNTDLEQEPAGTRASSPTHLGNMVRIDQKLMLQWPKDFLEIGYGLIGVLGLFYYDNYLVTLVRVSDFGSLIVHPYSS